VRRDCLAQKSPMNTPDRRKGVITDVSEESRRLLDVTEQERDSALWESRIAHLRDFRTDGLEE
jgi:hypothetical protein